MDTFTVLTFYLIERIESEFKKFTGSRHDFVDMVLKRYGVRVNFCKTEQGVVTSVDYDDIIREFEKKTLLAEKITLYSTRL